MISIISFLTSFLSSFLPFFQGLTWSLTGSVVKATGVGKDPSFYSFAGTMNKGTIVGVMIEPMKGEKVRQEEINSNMLQL